MPEIDPSRVPRTSLPPFAQALIVRAKRDRPDGRRLSGAELVAIRKIVMGGIEDGHPAAAYYKEERAKLRALRPEDMPPPAEDVWLLIETLSTRLGCVGHAQAWPTIGITAKRGRDLLARSATSVDWPIWVTLLRAALD